MGLLRILIADDSQFMRTAFKRIFDTEDGFEVVALASDGAEALEKVLELLPDVAILDVRMPIMDGISVAQSIANSDSETGVVIVTHYDDLAFVSAIMKNGATGKAYILKHSLNDISEIVRVVKAVSKGRAALDNTIVQNLLALYRRLPGSQSTAPTDMEESILELILEGYDEFDITQILGLPLEPVEALAASLCKKLGLTEEEGQSRSPLLVQAIINWCIP